MDRVTLHLLTACTRPENLPAIAASIATAAAAAPGIDLCWHITPDPQRQHVGGQAIKNHMIDSIADGWIYILDDDTLMHPGLLAKLADIWQHLPGIQLIVFSQQLKDRVRVAHYGMLKATHVDAGQVVIKRSAIGDTRIPLHYCGDGEYIEAIAGTIPPGQIVLMPEPLTLYNALRGYTA